MQIGFIESGSKMGAPNNHLKMNDLTNPSSSIFKNMQTFLVKKSNVKCTKPFYIPRNAKYERNFDLVVDSNKL